MALTDIGFDEIPRHRRRSGKKRFGIEIKLRGRWRRWSRYETRRQRDQALRTLQNKTDYGKQLFEYRVEKQNG